MPSGEDYDPVMGTDACAPVLRERLLVTQSEVPVVVAAPAPAPAKQLVASQDTPACS